MGCWSSVLGHLGVFSSFGCPALGVCLLPGEGLAAGLGDEDIAKDSLLSDADEEKVRSSAIVGIDRAELIRILELSISAGCFCHITDADSHGIVSDKALSTLRTHADQVGTETVELRL